MNEYPTDTKGGRKAIKYIQIGRQEVIDWIKSHQLISPDNDSLTRFNPFYQIEAGELKKWSANEKDI